MMPRRRRGRARGSAFAGWRVVLGAFLLLMSGFGAIYSYAVFAEEIAVEFGASRVSLSFVYALSGSACFFVSAVSGPVADRLGPRIPAAIGVLLVTLGLAVAAAASSLAEVYAGYGLLIGLGTGFAYVPAMAAVQGWFTTHRGLASGVAVSGIGVGTALVPPAAEAILATADWRAGFVLLGGFVAVAGLAGALLLEPGERRAAVPAGAPAPPEPDSRGFPGLWFGVLMVSVPATLPHAMLVGAARDMAMPWREAVGLLGLIGIGTIAGRFVVAAVSDAIGRRASFLACCAGMALSMLVWAVADRAGVLRGFALAFGALQGGFVALLPAFVVDAFGTRAAGARLGMLYTSRGLALLLAPPGASAAATAAGFGLPVAAAGGTGLAGTLLLLRVGRQPGRSEPPDPAGERDAPPRQRAGGSGAPRGLRAGDRRRAGVRGLSAACPVQAGIGVQCGDPGIAREAATAMVEPPPGQGGLGRDDATAPDLVAPARGGGARVGSPA